jgi:hypothetical protein
MDDYEGAADDPVSLHKYLYADNDAIDPIYPSGRFLTDLVEVYRLATVSFRTDFDIKREERMG